MKKAISWKDKIVKVKEVASTPPLNKAGFWKRREPEGFKVIKEDGK